MTTRSLMAVLIGVFVLIGTLNGQESSIEGAQQAYISGDYVTAIAGFTELADTRPGAEIHFNLAAAYLQNQQEGYALASFLRAQQFQPRLPELPVWIELLRTTSIQSGQNRGDWDTFSQFRFALDSAITLQEHFWFFAGTWTVLFASLPFTRARKLLSALILTIMLVSGLSLGVRFVLDQQRPLAVIINASAPVYSGPAEDYLQLYTLYEATEVVVIEIRNGWARFETRGSRSGWIAVPALSFILPENWRNNPQRLLLQQSASD